MRLHRRTLTLMLLLLLVPLASLWAADEESLRFGYVDGDLDTLALTANTGYVYCEPTGTLALHPDFAEEAQKRLEVEVLADGSWVTKEGKVLKPQTAKYLIDSGDGKGDGTLELIAPEKVVLASRLIAGECGTLIAGYKCQTDSNCSNACFGTTLWSSGPARFSNCVAGAATDRCFQTSGSVTCTFTKYSGPGCTGSVISSGTQTFPNCQ